MAIVVVVDDVVVTSVVVVEDSVVDDSSEFEVDVDDAPLHPARRSPASRNGAKRFKDLEASNRSATHIARQEDCTRREMLVYRQSLLRR